MSSKSTLGSAALFVTCALCACEADPKDWVIKVAGEEKPPGNRVLGVGLQTTLLVGLECNLPCLSDIPEDLIVSPGDERTVEVQILDERPLDDRQDAIEVVVTPLSAGSNRLRFVAENADEKGTFVFEAEQATGGRIHYTVREAAGSQGDATVFVDNIVGLQPSFFVADKPTGGSSSVVSVERRLTGSSPTKLVGPPNADTELLGDWLTLGDEPRRVKVTTEAGLGELTIEAVDEGAISKLEWSVAEVDRIDDGIWVREGTHFSLRIEPRSADGRSILGQAPTSLEMEIQGDAVDEDTVDRDEFWLVAKREGRAAAKVTWGEARLDIPITVAPLAGR